MRRNLNGEIVHVYQPGQSVTLLTAKAQRMDSAGFHTSGASGKRNYMAIGQTR
ncbi:hypothetical protein MU448_11575 [Streptococcus sp. O1]|nr:hypothetical protein [Streptococcus sp. O1]MCQ9214983.1 hypothetical protein [Streptococcus sp. O1]